MKRTSLLMASVVAGCLAGGGCGKKDAGPGNGPADFPVQVVVTAAKVQPVTERLSLVGTLIPDEAIEIKSETDGTVEEILFREGQRVKQGELLIRLDETKLQAALDQAEATFNLSKANLERLKTLREQGSASQQEYDQALASFEMNRASVDLRRRQLKDARIYAPFDGVMGPRLVSPGQVISKNALLGSLVAVDPLKVELNVPERFLSQAQVGQTIEITVAAWPGERFKGEVYFIAPQLDVATRTALVKARLPNPESKLKPGMFANLDLTLNVRERAIVVPEAAILMRMDRAAVYVVGNDNTAELRPVKVGHRLPGFVEITEGLRDGETVVVEGTQKVRPGGKVRPTSSEGTASVAETGGAQ